MLSQYQSRTQYDYNWAALIPYLDHSNQVSLIRLGLKSTATDLLGPFIWGVLRCAQVNDWPCVVLCFHKLTDCVWVNRVTVLQTLQHTETEVCSGSELYWASPQTRTWTGVHIRWNNNPHETSVFTQVKNRIRTEAASWKLFPQSHRTVKPRLLAATTTEPHTPPAALWLAADLRQDMKQTWVITTETSIWVLERSCQWSLCFL